MSDVFKLVAVRRAWWPVTFDGATEEGDPVKNRIELRFVLPDEEQLLSLMDEANAIDEMLAVSAAELDYDALIAARLAFVHRVADNWRGIGDESGVDLPWRDEHIVKVLRMLGLFTAIVTAFNNCMRGARPGN